MDDSAHDRVVLCCLLEISGVIGVVSSMISGVPGVIDSVSGVIASGVIDGVSNVIATVPMEGFRQRSASWVSAFSGRSQTLDLLMTGSRGAILSHS